MVEKTQSMLKSSLDALVNLDTDLAVKVCILDDEVDEINGEIPYIFILRGLYVLIELQIIDST